MKKIILLLIIAISLSGCYVSYRTPYYQRYPHHQKHYQPNKKYIPYFRHGRW